jgi:predicted O-linked N-acetylglucosamine transferase (SPINDLY family)
LAWRSPHIERWSKFDLTSRRIRLGIVSAYLYDHSVGVSFVNTICNLDPNKFEVHILYLGSPPEDAIYRRIQQSSCVTHIVREGNLTYLRERIAALELDILFYPDIGMSSLGYFLAFSRLAPVQITSFGHPDTTGIPQIDYYLSAEAYEPPQAQEHYSETLLTLPGAFMLSDYDIPTAPSSKTRADFGLEEQDFIFLCPQTLYKIHPDMLGYWQACVASLPQAKLLLIEPKQKSWRIQLDAVLAKEAPELEAHIVWLPHQARYADYLALMRCADVLLDNLHFNGYNTNLDAFSVDLPIVTQAGELQRGRVTAAMLLALGLEELIAHDASTYARIVQRLVLDKGYQTSIRSRITATKHRLYQRKDVTSLIEHTFIEALGRL